MCQAVFNEIKSIGIYFSSLKLLIMCYLWTCCTLASSLPVFSFVLIVSLAISSGIGCSRRGAARSTTKVSESVTKAKSTQRPLVPVPVFVNSEDRTADTFYGLDMKRLFPKEEQITAKKKKENLYFPLTTNSLTVGR